MGRVRASFRRLSHNVGPITVVGGFILLAALIFLVLRVVALQQAQAESSKNGRALLKQVVDLTKQVRSQNDTIKSFTDPNSQASKDQQTKTANILAELDAAQRAGRADQLMKVAQMLEQCPSLPCSPAIINRILAQPVPVPTFAGMAAVTPAPVSVPTPIPSSTPTATHAATPRPTPSRSPFLQVQCPVICPQSP